MVSLTQDERVFARQDEPRETGLQVMPEESGASPTQILESGAISKVITRTVSTNAGALLYDSGSTDITMSIYYGLRWAANPSERGGFYMQRPADWDGQTPVVATITFALGSGQAGAINWRLRLNHYTPNNGEWLTNPASHDADTILTFPDGSSLRIFSQTFTIPAEDFNEEPYWSFFFTRGDGSNGEVYPGILYVMGADIEYQALLPADFLYLPIIVR
jgi:hypothetical protein